MRDRARRVLVVVVVLASIRAAPPAGARKGAPPTGSFAPAEQAVRQALDQYRVAWLANDATRVVGTLTEDAILLPDPPTPLPIAGREGILKYWWPAGGTSTTITRFDQPVLDVHGSGDFASAYGTSLVEWRTGGSTAPQSSRSQWAAVLRRGTNGQWRIRSLAWVQIP